MEKKLSIDEIIGVLKKWRENLVQGHATIRRVDFLKKFNLLLKDTVFINTLIDKGYHFFV